MNTEAGSGGGAPPSRKKKILIVDDDQLLLGTYSSVFRMNGFDVEVASDGETAFKMLQESQSLPDIVFTGIKMPGMDGFALIEKMRDDPRLAKISTAVSSHRGLDEDKKRSESLGVSDFIIQGFTTPAEVARRINVILGVNKKFKIFVAPDRFSAGQLIEALNRQSGASCQIAPGEEVVLELEATSEPDKFRVRIIC